jgi:hypothetical protein
VRIHAPHTSHWCLLNQAESERLAAIKKPTAAHSAGAMCRPAAPQRCAITAAGHNDVPKGLSRRCNRRRANVPHNLQNLLSEPIIAVCGQQCLCQLHQTTVAPLFRTDVLLLGCCANAALHHQGAHNRSRSVTAVTYAAVPLEIVSCEVNLRSVSTWMVQLQLLLGGHISTILGYHDSAACTAQVMGRNSVVTHVRC